MSDAAKARTAMIRAFAPKPQKMSAVTAIRAKVDRVEGDTAYVRFADGAEPTPVSMAVSAWAGDTVIVQVDGRTRTITGNKTNVSATEKDLGEVKDIAEEANRAFNEINDIAIEADKTLGEIIQGAADASADIQAIENYVGMAEEYDKTLTQRVEEAEASAGAASQSAASAASEAAAAAQSASSASTSAARAESGLARVQDVVGTVNWLAKHSRQTADTEAKEGKDYYSKNPDTDTLTLVEAPANPAEAGLYELSQSVNDYIASYLALVGDTLRLSSGGTARVELSPDALQFIASDGNVVASIEVGADGKSVMRITRSVVLEDMQFGDWNWYSRRNGNMSLKWVG